jgi:hypothetical protein
LSDDREVLPTGWLRLPWRGRAHSRCGEPALASRHGLGATEQPRSLPRPFQRHWGRRVARLGWRVASVTIKVRHCPDACQDDARLQTDRPAVGARSRSRELPLWGNRPRLYRAPLLRSSAAVDFGAVVSSQSSWRYHRGLRAVATARLIVSISAAPCRISSPMMMPGVPLMESASASS